MNIVQIADEMSEFKNLNGVVMGERPNNLVLVEVKGQILSFKRENLKPFKRRMRRIVDMTGYIPPTRKKKIF